MLLWTINESELYMILAQHQNVTNDETDVEKSRILNCILEI